MEPRSDAKTWLTFALLMALFLVLPCLLISVAVPDQGSAPPRLNLRFGGVEVAADITDNPNCPLARMPCPIVPAMPNQDFYTLWIFVTTHHPNGVEISSRRLLMLPL